MSQYFGIGLCLKIVTASDEPGFDLRVVLDNAVVDHGDLSALIGMRVSVEVAWSTVRGPAGMAYADR